MKTRLLLLLSAMLATGGCLSKPSLMRESFSFTAPPANAPAKTNGPVLGLRGIFVVPPFDRQQFTYRTADVSFENDPYAGFLVTPAESLSEPVRALLRDGGVFSEVTERSSPLRPDLEAVMTVTQLYGDFRHQSSPAAVMSLRLLVYRAGTDGPGQVLLQKTYDERVPLKSRTAAAVMSGWNQALQAAMSAVLSDMEAALKKDQ